jgi:hypothetical protein
VPASRPIIVIKRKKLTLRPSESFSGIIERTENFIILFNLLRSHHKSEISGQILQRVLLKIIWKINYPDFNFLEVLKLNSAGLAGILTSILTSDF